MSPRVAGGVCIGFATLGNYAYFAGWDFGHGWELWRTDGTEAGTKLFADIYPGRKDSSPGWLSVVGDRIVFSAEASEIGRELWAVGEAGVVRRRSVGR
jgi:ELWxxDGT repeat protein